MKYKLININTKEEHLCDKVIIDGFDYYVTDNSNDLGGWHIDKEFKILSNVSRFNVVTEMREIIATNNPNIDVAKVVDEAELLAKNIYRDNPTDRKDAIYRYNTDINAPRKRKAFVKGYKKSQETHPFNEEDIVEFNEWCNKNYEFDNRCNQWFYGNGYCTTKELLQLWKEQQPKTVYYE